jgi:integrase
MTVNASYAKALCLLFYVALAPYYVSLDYVSQAANSNPPIRWVYMKRNHVPELGKRTYDVWIRKFNRWNRGRNITPFRVLQFFDTQFEELSQSTKKVARSGLLLAIERDCIRRKRTSQFADFLYAMRRVKIRVRREKVKHITFAQFRKLHRASDKRHRFILEALWDTGARIGEVLSVPVSGYERNKDGTITVRVKGKGGEKIDLDYTRELFFQTLAFFRGVRWLYENPRTGEPLTSRAVQRYVGALSFQVLGFRITPHWIRHGVASRLYSRTKDVKLVQTFLHHRSAQTTMDYYVTRETDQTRALRTISFSKHRRTKAAKVTQGQRPGMVEHPKKNPRTRNWNSFTEVVKDA